jgi:hypothetical protein
MAKKSGKDKIIDTLNYFDIEVADIRYIYRKGYYGTLGGIKDVFVGYKPWAVRENCENGHFDKYKRDSMLSNMNNKELIKEYPVQDDIWPSRRWNKDKSDYIDLGEENMDTLINSKKL